MASVFIFLANVYRDASRAIGVNLWRDCDASAAWHPRFVLPSVAANEGQRAASYEIPPGCPEKPLIRPGNLRRALARPHHCDPWQFETAHTQRRKPEIADSISWARAPHVRYWSPQLSRMTGGLAVNKSCALGERNHTGRKRVDTG